MLTNGARLGPYEVVSAAGAGGMGEVYKARDIRLDRIVALKILPPDIAADPSLRERFDREARTIASLSHPNICSLFDVGHDEGTDFLVMEFLEGETLEQRLQKGPLPIGEAIAIGINIAEALAAAHRAGIVHRDLKPGNIMLTKSGPKLLDFGLARTGMPSSVGGLSMLPTTPHNLTISGTILGTFQYMAPEQLEGQEADARTDIFALGAVLYETLTGRRAFDGKSQATLITSILRDAPSAVSTVQPLTTPAVDRVVQKALEKSPDARWQSAADLADELRWAMRTPTPTLAAPERGRRRARPAIWVAGAAALIGAFVAGYVVKPSHDSALPPVAIFQLDIPPGMSVSPSVLATPMFAVSPDGRALAYRATSGGDPSQLWIRPLDSFDAKRISTGGNLETVFWSPDSKSLAYVQSGVLRVLDVTTNVSRVVAPLQVKSGGVQLGGAWGVDGTIVLGGNSLNDGSGLVRVNAAGGAVTPLTMPSDDTRDGSPSFLDSRTIVFARSGRGQGIYVMSLDGGEPRRISADFVAPHIADGVLFFVRGTTLLAQPIDRKGNLSSEPATVTDSVASNSANGLAGYSVGESGPIVFSSARIAVSQFTWFSSAGAVLGTVGDPDIMTTLEMSRDGVRAVYGVRDSSSGAQNLWTTDLQRNVRTKLTFGATRDSDGTWSPDGSQFAFSSIRNGEKSIYVRPVSGGSERMLVKGEGLARSVDDWSPDGKWVLYHIDGRGELWAQPTVEGGQPQMVAKAQAATIDEAVFSPDGHWIAYSSAESGRWEVYLVPFPATGARWQVTPNGGMQPQWRGDGRTLFFLTSDGGMNAIDVTPAPGPKFGEARTLFKTSLIPVGSIDQYAVTPDGNRFLVMNPVGRDAEPPPTVLMNWKSLFAAKPQP